MNLNSIIKKHFKLGVIILLFIVVGFEIVIINKDNILSGSRLAGSRNYSFENLEVMASNVVEICSREDYRPACYDKEIPKLMDKISMEDAFEVTRAVQVFDPEYSYCHVLGHELSAVETRKDPDKWKDVINRCPSGVCSNGCIHGAFQERFRTESMPDVDVEQLMKELDGICEAREGFNPTGLEKGTCYHALGHLTMYITEANIERSLNLCEKLAYNNFIDYRQVCYDGVFMQIFQPLEPEDFALIEGMEVEKEDLQDFCDQYSGDHRSSCWTEGWPLHWQEISTSPDNLVNFCSYLAYDPEHHDRCYLSVMYVVTALTGFNEEFIQEYCSELPRQRRGGCFANAASRMIETDWRNIDKSVHLCGTAQELGMGEDCYQELVTYSTYNFHQGSEEYYNLCNSLPEVWARECLRGN